MATIALWYIYFLKILIASQLVKILSDLVDYCPLLILFFMICFIKTYRPLGVSSLLMWPLPFKNF